MPKYAPRVGIPVVTAAHSTPGAASILPDFDVHVAPELFCLEGAARRDWASFLLMGAADALLLTRLAGFIDALAGIQPQLERPIGLREFVITLNE